MRTFSSRCKTLPYFDQPKKCLLVLVLAVASLASAAGSAGAATVTKITRTTLELEDTVGETNTVTVSESSTQVIFEDSTSTLTAGSGCSASGSQIVCNKSGLTRVRLTLQAKNDTANTEGMTSLKTLFFGASSDDTFTPGNIASDELNGGNGTDTADYGSRSGSVTITLDDIADDGESSIPENDNVKSDIEDLISGSGDDILIGSTADNKLSSGAGTDQISGEDGNDTLDGGTGSDDINGGTGTDTVDYSSRTSDVFVTLDDINDDGEVSEADNVKSDVENITSGSGNDTLTGSATANVINSGTGNDKIAPGAGVDTISTGDDNDEIDSSGDGEADSIDCGAGSDVASADHEDVVAANCETVTYPGDVTTTTTTAETTETTTTTTEGTTTAVTTTTDTTTPDTTATVNTTTAATSTAPAESTPSPSATASVQSQPPSLSIKINRKRFIRSLRTKRQHRRLSSHVKALTGAKFEIKSSDATSVEITLKRVSPAPKSDLRIKRILENATLTFDLDSDGLTTKSWNGWANKLPLKSGRYVAVAVAKNSAGSSSDPQTLRFRIIKPRTRASH